MKTLNLLMFTCKFKQWDCTYYPLNYKKTFKIIIASVEKNVEQSILSDIVGCT